jgi:hypothetical protein
MITDCMVFLRCSFETYTQIVRSADQIRAANTLRLARARNWCPCCGSARTCQGAKQEMTVDELKARLAVLGLKLPESDHTPLLGMATEIERAALSVRQHLEMTDEMGIIFPTDRMAGGAS